MHLVLLIKSFWANRSVHSTFYFFCIANSKSAANKYTVTTLYELIAVLYDESADCAVKRPIRAPPSYTKGFVNSEMMEVHPSEPITPPYMLGKRLVAAPTHS
jgi:hypothetical protein